MKGKPLGSISGLSQIAAMAGAISLLCPLAMAAPRQRLQGAVQQNVNPPSDLDVQKVVLDMYHLLSSMWGNASPAAQKAFQADLNQFSGFVSQGSALASKLVPCVQKYQQAYPHVVQESQYYTQNNSTAFNAQAAIANPLIKDGASCVSSATADEFATNTGKTSNIPGSSPPLSPPTSVSQAQNGAWMPRCATPTSTNCYLWLLNPNGLYSHIYRGGPPNCAKGLPGGYDPSQNPACQALVVPQPQPPQPTWPTLPPGFPFPPAEAATPPSYLKPGTYDVRKNMYQDYRQGQRALTVSALPDNRYRITVFSNGREQATAVIRWLRSNGDGQLYAVERAPAGTAQQLQLNKLDLGSSNQLVYDAIWITPGKRNVGESWFLQ